MSGWTLSVRLSEAEHHLLEVAAGHLELTLPELLAQGAAAYACLCGFWSDSSPVVDVRVSPYWDTPPRGAMRHIVEVPFAREALNRVGKACDYVRTVCGDSLVGVPLGEFIVGGHPSGAAPVESISLEAGRPRAPLPRGAHRLRWEAAAAT